MNREQAEQEVMYLAEAWAAAELRRDTAFLEQRLIDDFIGIGPLGFMLTKQEWITRYQSGDLQYDSFTLDAVRVRVYNEAAIVTGRQAQQGAYQGNNIQGHFRITLMFVYDQNQWRLASLHLSTIGQALPFAQSRG